MDIFDWILYFSVGPLMVLLAAMFKVFPPKKINMWYGYRTERSMRNQETWDAANSFANNFMLWLFVGISIVELALFISMDNKKHAALIGCGMLVFGLIFLVVFTERYLIKRFG
ncbi:MAG: SdpI family protein [Fulvivirga sp.]